MRIRKTFILILGSLAGIHQGWAQTTPDPAQTLKQELERVAPPIRQQEFPAIDLTTERREASELDGLRITVKAFKFEGVKSVPQEALFAVVAPYIGKEIDFKGLQAVARLLEAEYRKRGVPLAQAVLPKQDVTEGIVTIRLIEGRAERGPSGLKIRSEGEFRVRPEVLQRTVDSTLGSDDAITDSGLERVTLLLNDLAGVSASVGFEPGSEPGEVRILLSTKEVARVTGSATADTAGNRLTGTGRYGVNVNLNSPMGFGEQLTVNATESFDANFNFQRVSYLMPLTGQGLSLNLAYSRASFDVGQELAQFQSSGTADNLTVGLRYPLIRAREKNLYATVAYDEKKSRAYSDVSLAGVPSQQSQKETTLGSFGVSGDLADGLGGGGFNSFSLVLSAGSIDLSKVYPIPTNPGDLTEQEADAQNLKTEGKFKKMVFNLARSQTIGKNSSASLTINYQQPFGSKNLDSSEKLSLGGWSGVRAYPGGEASADKAFIGQFEFRTMLARGLPEIGDFSVLAFYDYGEAELNTRPNAGVLNRYSLKGHGFGVVLGRTGKHELKFYMTEADGRNPAETAQGKDSDGKSGRRYTAFLSVPF